MVSLKMILVNSLKMRHFPKCNVSIGKYTTSVPYIISVECTDRVTIGKYCSIAHGVVLVAHPGHIPPRGYEDYRVATYQVSRVGSHGYLPHSYN
jgi:hypothetical protein